MTKPTDKATTPAGAGASQRAWAARAVSAVLDDKRSLDAALAAVPASLPGADRALVSALAYGTLREYRRLDAILAPRVSRAPQPLLNALLLVGLYQLEYMRVPAHAAVHATVSATGELKLDKARGMVNAILRGHQRAGVPKLSEAPGLVYSHPDWLVEAIRRDWPDRWEDVLAANNAQAPMHLRVNRRATSRDSYLLRLGEHELVGTPMPFDATGVTLAEPVSAAELPGFASGEVSIQDGGAQRAAGLLAPEDGQRVLDACAAPGNKSAHLLESADIDLLALDVDAARLATLGETLERLNLKATAVAADACDLDAWWDGRPFDRILLDAPCSGTGVIRRHPDIKWLRRESDIAAAVRRQIALLNVLWRALAPGGRLVYATCSLLRAEGVDVVADFLDRRPDAREHVMDVEWGEAEAHGRRIAPGDHEFDGFYYAVLERTAD
ncbi:16S rRNA (cytosine(967)-C(5))-methyltransferase RsmB [Salinisphaera aquimarina]|uniref:16S rRNA (cytosine(967)-C(5))-methyltransferase n=1 Tax=Salinisphaera aquimarina TaxID=2094031 RepID=A0ABV7EIQ3_9GAMM